MTPVEVRQSLAELQLNQQEAAKLLGVSPRSVRRWLEGEAIPGPAEAALRAWRQLEERGLAWRPDSVSLFEDNQERIALYRQEAMKLDALLERVIARGGPRLPWKVDIEEGRATMEWASLSFYKLQNGGFSPSVYRRSDENAPPDLERDRELIEDALYCIATTFQRAERRARALRAVADDIREHSSNAGIRGRDMISDADKQVRTRAIDAIADRVALLATRSELGDKTNYQQFEKLRAALGQLGLGTNQTLVSEVARSFFEGAPKVRLIFLRPGRLDNAITWSKEFSPEIVREKITGCRLILMGEKLRPISGSSHELADPERIVLHVPPGVEFPGASQAGYYVVADLHPSQLGMR